MVSTPLDSVLSQTWKGLKKRNIEPWSDGLVHRPKSETPGDAVSEGQAYGMILAMYQNDAAAFNSIWDATESKMWNATKGYYDWRYQDGKITGTGMATDADQDIALMLIFADALQTKGIWASHNSPKGVSYKARAQSLLATLWNSGVYNGNLRPGAGWGGGEQSQYCKCDFVNPGYFSPASYRIFQQFDASRNWNSVLESSYQMIAKNPGYSKGLLPDWMTTGGGEVPGSALGYNPFYEGKTLYKDAIRVHWRLAMDYLWFQEPRAKSFLDNAYSFVGRDPAKANFYRMDGSLVPVESTFTLSGTAGPVRSRREHSHLTVGQWACAAMVSGGADSADAWAEELLKFHTPGADFWGLALDPSGAQEDTAHNEVYFDQFLSWFGASVLAGRFTNILADLNAADASTKQAWKTSPSIAGSLALPTASVRIAGTLAKPAAWAARIVQPSTGLVWGATGVGSSIALDWKGLSSQGEAFSAGDVAVSLRVRGLSDTTVVFALSDDVRAKIRKKGFAVTPVAGGISVSAPEPCRLRVQDLSGRILATANLEAGSARLAVAAKGLVLVETRSQSGVGSDKILLRP
jgi:endo-1,4-beta-D-glucanase Y